MFLKLFSSCKIVKGYVNSLIMDVQRGIYISIPNTLYEVIKILEKKTIEEIKTVIDNENSEVFDSYIDFLTGNELGFLTNEPKNYVYHDYDKIDIPSYNAILDLSAPFLNDEILIQLEYINIEALHLNIYSTINSEQIKEILNKIVKLTTLKYVSILCMYSKVLNESILCDLAYFYPILSQITVYSSPFEKCISNNVININYDSRKLVTPKSCGLISSKHFKCNNDLYKESHYFNSCIAGKISIDINGNIKNCPSMAKEYGNTKNITLKEALNHKDFKKYWKLTKDEIEVCKDCEYRYICTDCRAYTERSHTSKEGLDTSKPLKCGYNPYTGEWEDWNKNILKQKAIKYYGM